MIEVPSLADMPTIDRLLQERSRLAGDIAEFGVYMGTTTAELAKYGRRVWAFDTFSGIPAEDFDESIDVDRPGRFSPPDDLDAFAASGEDSYRFYGILALSPLIHVLAGRFADTLPVVPSDVRILLAYVDCDLLRSAQQVFEWLPSRLVPGGAIVADDYDDSVWMEWA